MTSFIAIDFETANHRRNSPIQMGLTPVVNGQVFASVTTAVLPPFGCREFHPSVTAVHGLQPDYIIGAPAWAEVHERLQTYIHRWSERAGHPLALVAHNASFERSVIVQTSETEEFTPHPFDYVCTLKMARAVDKEAPNHKLDTLAERYGIEQLAHHDAGDDSRVGALLALHLVGLGATLEAGLLR